MVAAYWGLPRRLVFAVAMSRRRAAGIAEARTHAIAPRVRRPRTHGLGLESVGLVALGSHEFLQRVQFALFRLKLFSNSLSLA